MIEFKVQKVTIWNGGGELTCEMGELPWHDFLMLTKQSMVRPRRKTQDTKIKSGSFWRPNAELKKRTHGDSSHAYYDDAYLLQAAGEHTKITEEVEIAEMPQRIAAATDFSLIMLDYRACTAEELTTAFEIQTANFLSLSKVRNEDKVEAREQIAETLDVVDSLDRINPMAKAMRSGAANARFRRRRQGAMNIRNNEIVRTKCVSDMIKEHLDLYLRLWKALSMHILAPNAPAEPEQVFGQSAGLESDTGSLLSEIRGKAGLQAAERRMQFMRDEFAAVKIRPFCKNAAYVVRGLGEAIKFCQEGDRANLNTRLRKLRRGIRWIFALDELQMKVILPFSILLDKLRRIIKRERSENGTFVKGPIVIPRKAAPDLFKVLESELLLVRTKIRDKCRDGDFQERHIKEDVELYLGTAQDAMAADDWQLAKNCLLRAARCL
ncbi:MAG: hypothetical protein WC551_05200 [Patescibacteria group bacterium]